MIFLRSGAKFSFWCVLTPQPKLFDLEHNHSSHEIPLPLPSSPTRNSFLLLWNFMVQVELALQLRHLGIKPSALEDCVNVELGRVSIHSCTVQLIE